MDSINFNLKPGDFQPSGGPGWSRIHPSLIRYLDMLEIIPELRVELTIIFKKDIAQIIIYHLREEFRRLI